MAKKLIAILVLMLVGWHAGTPASASGQSQLEIAFLVGEGGLDGGDEETGLTFPDTSNACHDSCNWLADWNALDLNVVALLSRQMSATALRQGLIARVVPPPR